MQKYHVQRREYKLNFGLDRARYMLLGIIFLLAACEAAKSLPPARRPELQFLISYPDGRRILTVRVCNIPNMESKYYVGRNGFYADVQMQYLDRLDIFENNTQLKRFSSPFDPDFRNSTEPAYTSEDVATGEDWRIERVYIRAPQNGWNVSQSNTYTFRATSLNPDLVDVSQKYASIDLPVVVVDSLSDYQCPAVVGPVTGSSGSSQECQLTSFIAPNAVKKGEAVGLDWRISNCQKAQLLENNIVILELTPPPNNPKNIIGTAVYKIEQPTTYELRSIEGNMTKKLAEKYINISACTGGGNPKQFIFCIKCSADGPLQTSYTSACTEQEAKQGLESQYGGCTINTGACSP
jgi:hypothetical protein